MSGIFLSYRNIKRSYAPMFVDWVLDHRFGAANVFEAGRSNLPGTPFPDEIQRRLEQCTLLIVLIDAPWLAELDLLRDPGDWVRHEILYAIEHGREVLPVLLDGVHMPKRRDLPDELTPLTRNIALRMSSRTAHADVLGLVGAVERLAPDLVLATLMDPALPAPDSPAALIRAEHEVFPFRHRPEFDQLVTWCSAPNSLPARLVVGPVGTGKTRLGLRLCARMRGTGRPAGMLSVSATAKALERLGEIGAPCLVVIDDAETRPLEVAAALRALAAVPDAPSRLLLLARAGGDWLERLREDRDDRVASLAERLIPVPLKPLTPVEDDVATARATFAHRLGLPVALPPAGGSHPATLLEVQVTALVDLLPPDQPPRSPWQRIADLERDHWRRTAVTFSLPDLRRDHLTEIMAVVTLFGAATEPEADALVAALRAFREMPLAVVDAARDFLRTVLPGRAPLNRLEPEPLADHVVVQLLGSGYRLSGVLDRVTDVQARTALIILGRCLAARSDLGGPVGDFLADAPARLLPLAMTALPAIARPELLVAPMSAALDRIPAASLDELVAALPQRSEALARFAADVTERALAARRAAGAVDVATARLARLFATRLAYLEERASEAVTAANTAVDILETLAQPGTEADLAEAYAALALARDLEPMSADEALSSGERAIQGYRAMPFENRYQAALTTVMINQVVRLARVGRTVEARDMAVEAHEVASALHQVRPARYRSLYADAKDNLSILTRDEQLSRETLALRRALATARPDAYRPQLAGTLYNLGVILAANADAEAEGRTLWRESFAIFQELAAAQPGRFGDLLSRVRAQLERVGG